MAPLVQATADIAIIGAGAAGLAAASRLRAEGCSVVVLEARSRIGGRAFTLTPDETLPLDMGCGWLHSADENLLTAPIEALGLTIDRTPPPWTRPASQGRSHAAAMRRFSEAYMALDQRLEAAAATGVDRPASELLIKDDPSNPRLNAVSAYYNGCTWDEVSVLDYAAYRDTQVNWRVREGYGAAIALLGARGDLHLNTLVRAIDLRGQEARVVTEKGDVNARTVIVSVPTPVLAEERIRILPRPHDLLEAASGLPLGHANKVFLGLTEANAFKADTQLAGREDRAETGGYALRPMGRPYIEGYFGGRHAAGLEAEGRDAMFAFALEELAGVLGSNIRKILRPIAASAWSHDPFALGAYSHAKPGCHEARATLAQPLSDRLFMAGEATHRNFFSTAHGAYESGMRAAEQALAVLR